MSKEYKLHYTLKSLEKNVIKQIILTQGERWYLTAPVIIPTAYIIITLKDHIGNVCAVVNANTDTVVQRTMYYASGVPMAQSFIFRGRGQTTTLGQEPVVTNYSPKILRNGQILILRSDKTYTLQGQQVE